MKKIGGYVVNSETGEKGFTLAAILMFGLEETILSVLPHYYVDFREKLSNDPEQVELTLFLGSSTTKTTTTTPKTTTKEQILELIKANPSVVS